MHAKPARAYRHDGCTTSALHTMHADSVMRPAPTACCFPTGGMQSATTPRSTNERSNGANDIVSAGSKQSHQKHHREHTVSNKQTTEVRARNGRAHSPAVWQPTNAICSRCTCTSRPPRLQQVVHVPASEGDQVGEHGIMRETTDRSGRGVWHHRGWGAGCTCRDSRRDRFCRSEGKCAYV